MLECVCFKTGLFVARELCEGVLYACLTECVGGCIGTVLSPAIIVLPTKGPLVEGLPATFQVPYPDGILKPPFQRGTYLLCWLITRESTMPLFFFFFGRRNCLSKWRWPLEGRYKDAMS